jgi:hypothetical protein
MPDVTLRTLANTGDPIANPDGTPIANTTVTFDLVDLARKKTTSLFDAISGEVIIAQPVVVTTDANGIFSTPLWPNTRGEVATVYKVTVNSAYAKPFFIRIPDGTGAISLAAAKADIGAITAQEISLIQALIAGVSEATSSVIDAAALATASVATALVSSESAYSSKEAAEAYAVQTGLDRTATNQDAVATAADRLQTGLDRTAVAVASEIVTNNIAAINTVASNIAVINAVTEEAIAVAADRVQTSLDRAAIGSAATATAADRVQTGLDRLAAAASAAEAASFLGGSVIGPESATSDNFAVFDGETGLLIKDSGKKPADFAPIVHTHDFSIITAKPTTVAGYGITDAYTKTETDSAVSQAISNAVVWKPSVANFAAISIMYPTPAEGWTTSCTDTNAVYRYDAGSTTWIQTDAGAVPAASATVAGKVQLTDSTASTSVTTAATPSSVKSAYDLASSKQPLLVSGTNIKTINGIAIPGSGDIVIASGTGVTVSGTLTLYVTQSTTLAVTNYDSATVYAVTATAGTATITGDTITYTAGATAGSVTLAITAGAATRDLIITVNAVGISTPTNVSPANSATGQIDSVMLSASAFAWVGISTTHLNSDWQVATDSGFTAIVASSSADVTNKTSWTATGLSVNTTYYWRVRYRGATTAVSAYSAAFSFQTAASFNSYIATPSATPAAFGDAFEGGFYTGMIWNELVESATSTLIATGSKAFTVPDMTSVPIVYSGQALEIRSRANPANKMIGVVTGALGTALTINVTSVGGSGTFTDWSIMAKYRVIVAPKASGESTSKTYKVDNTAAPTACQTLAEGYKATLAMIAAGDATMYPAAWFCKNLSIGAKTDWYLPARDELELCWRNLKPGTESNYLSARADSAIVYATLGSLDDVTTEQGHNLNSSPQGAAYTASVPAQTAVTVFRTGGAESFAYGSYYYWSASEYSATYAWFQYWHSGVPGYQNATTKVNAYSVRAVRRSII